MKAILIFLLILFSFPLFSQTFEVNKLGSFIFISSALAIDLSNNYFDRQIIEPLTEDEIDNLSKDDIPFFDRWISFSPDATLKDWSDYCTYLTIGSTLFLIYDEGYFLDNLMVLNEILIAQSAISKWTKTLTHRKRPFVYDSEVSLGKQQQRNSQHSFYSSHSSTAFSTAVFGYYYYLDNYGPNIPVVILLFGSATATTVLRVASAQHFPSDVVVGAIMGSGISYLICKMNRSEKFNVNLGINSVRISYKF